MSLMRTRLAAPSSPILPGRRLLSPANKAARNKNSYRRILSAPPCVIANRSRSTDRKGPRHEDRKQNTLDYWHSQGTRAPLRSSRSERRGERCLISLSHTNMNFKASAVEAKELKVKRVFSISTILSREVGFIRNFIPAGSHSEPGIAANHAALCGSLQPPRLGRSSRIDQR